MDKEPRINNSHIPKYAEDSAVTKTAGTALTAAASTHTEATLTIDQHKAVYKIVDDIAKPILAFS